MSDEQYQFMALTDKPENYLDIWRGAFYSVMLGVIYSYIVPTPPVGLLALSVISFMTIYLVSDGITRYNSRRIIRRHLSSFTFFGEVILLVIEMIGLLAFVTWINNVPWNVNGVLKDEGYIAALRPLLGYLAEGNKSFVVFCFMNVCHNSFLVGLDRGCGFWKFLEYSLIDDASEIPKLSERWVPSLTIDKDAILKKLKEHLGEMKLFSAAFDIIKLSVMHLKVQWIALHTVFFNALAGFAIWCFPKERVFDFSFRWSLVSLISPALISLFAYGSTSYLEMRRLNKNELTGPGFYERVFQIAGNISLILLWIIIFLVSPKAVMVLLLLLMGCIFSFILIYLSKEPQPKSGNVQNQPDQPKAEETAE